MKTAEQDEPLPVTLDNIRKWDADMRGDDDQARHIALYYLATNLREVVGVLFAELDEARDKALDEAAEAVCGYIHPAYGKLPGDPFATAVVRALKSPKPPIL